MSIKYMAGTIESEDIMRFKKLLFRATRGKVLSYLEDIEFPIKEFSGRSVKKSIYVLVF